MQRTSYVNCHKSKMKQCFADECQACLVSPGPETSQHHQPQIFQMEDAYSIFSPTPGLSQNLSQKTATASEAIGCIMSRRKQDTSTTSGDAMRKTLILLPRSHQ